MINSGFGRCLERDYASKAPLRRGFLYALHVNTSMLLHHLFESTIYPPKVLGTQFGRMTADFLQQFYDACQKKDTLDGFYPEITLDGDPTIRCIVSFSTRNKITPPPSTALVAKLAKQYKLPAAGLDVDYARHDPYSWTVEIRFPSPDWHFEDDGDYDAFSSAAIHTAMSKLVGTAIQPEFER